MVLLPLGSVFVLLPLIAAIILILPISAAELVLILPLLLIDILVIPLINFSGAKPTALKLWTRRKMGLPVPETEPLPELPLTPEPQPRIISSLSP